MMYVFPHISKTAGTSLRMALEQEFPGRVQGAYDRPPHFTGLPSEWYPPVSDPVVVFGHCVDMYEHVYEDVPHTVIAFLRSPLSRAVSDWMHHRRNPDERLQRLAQGTLVDWLDNHQGDNDDPALRCNRMTTELMDMLKSPLAGTGDFPAHVAYAMDAVDCWGIVERMAESITLLNARFGWGLAMRKENVAGEPHPSVDPAVALRFRDKNASDYELYYKAGAALQLDIDEWVR